MPVDAGEARLRLSLDRSAADKGLKEFHGSIRELRPSVHLVAGAASDLGLALEKTGTKAGAMGLEFAKIVTAGSPILIGLSAISAAVAYVAKELSGAKEQTEAFGRAMADSAKASRLGIAVGVGAESGKSRELIELSYKTKEALAPLEREAAGLEKDINKSLWQRVKEFGPILTTLEERELGTLKEQTAEMRHQSAQAALQIDNLERANQKLAERQRIWGLVWKAVDMAQESERKAEQRFKDLRTFYVDDLLKDLVAQGRGKDALGLASAEKRAPAEIAKLATDIQRSLLEANDEGRLAEYERQVVSERQKLEHAKETADALIQVEKDKWAKIIGLADLEESESKSAGPDPRGERERNENLAVRNMLMSRGADLINNELSVALDRLSMSTEALTIQETNQLLAENELMSVNEAKTIAVERMADREIIAVERRVQKALEGIATQAGVEALFALAADEYEKAAKFGAVAIAAGAGAAFLSFDAGGRESKAIMEAGKRDQESILAARLRREDRAALETKTGGAYAGATPIGSGKTVVVQFYGNVYDTQAEVGRAIKRALGAANELD